ncbi:hypothetical protein HFN_2302 [Helicobacter fennelliae MRY12-0050]|uniref:Uncharacterized protein n=1 Tax=Helicobacter fennelliae MRY12-0050 TaxID=1325130 RepID=T1CNL9_9HELI|nr:hypothetical protein HFN_2302 [Helicobacter fennelliae MRY12-0050]
MFVLHYGIVLILTKGDFVAPNCILTIFFVISFANFLICCFIKKHTKILDVKGR